MKYEFVVPNTRGKCATREGLRKCPLRLCPHMFWDHKVGDLPDKAGIWSECEECDCRGAVAR